MKTSETSNDVLDTPRTDQAAITIASAIGKGGDSLDWISFARSMERELNMARTETLIALNELEATTRLILQASRTAPVVEAILTRIEGLRAYLTTP